MLKGVFLLSVLLVCTSADLTCPSVSPDEKPDKSDEAVCLLQMKGHYRDDLNALLQIVSCVGLEQAACESAEHCQMHRKVGCLKKCA